MALHVHLLRITQIIFLKKGSRKEILLSKFSTEDFLRQNREKVVKMSIYEYDEEALEIAEMTEDELKTAREL